MTLIPTSYSHLEIQMAKLPPLLLNVEQIGMAALLSVICPVFFSDL